MRQLENNSSLRAFKSFPGGFWTDAPNNPEEAVAYPEKYFTELFMKQGLETTRIISGEWWKNEFAQDILITRKTSDSARTLNLTPASDSDRIFNWAEKLHPTFFTPGATTKTYEQYTYRDYPRGVYLATSNGKVFMHDGKLWNYTEVGALADFLSRA